MERQGGVQLHIFTDSTELPNPFGFGTAWKERAACAGEWLLFDLVDDALNPKGRVSRARHVENQRLIAEAQALCASCPVIEQCRDAVLQPASPNQALAYSLVAGVPHLTYHPDWMEAERKRRASLDNRRRQLEERGLNTKDTQCEFCGLFFSPQNYAQHRRAHTDPWPHGTWKGYNRHRRLNETPCADCKAACAKQSRRVRANRKATRERLARVIEEGVA